ncbi:hypothetical protein CLBKND_04920 [Methylorubrum aminovorans]
MADKTKITAIQDANGTVKAVRINSAEIPVIHCGPAMGAGQMNFVLTIGNVEIEYEKAADAGS